MALNSLSNPQRIWSSARRALLVALSLLVLVGGIVPFEAGAQSAKPAKTRATPAKPSAKAAKPSAKAAKPSAKPSAARAKSGAKPAARRVTRAKTSATRSAKQTPVRRVARRKPASAAKPRVPLQPSSERLTEIQSALAREGFLQGEPSGKWDDASIQAMKRFQDEHSIPATGKINSLSLIALGLGPQRGPAPGSESVLESSPASQPSAASNPSADR